MWRTGCKVITSCLYLCLACWEEQDSAYVGFGSRLRLNVQSIYLTNLLTLSLTPTHPQWSRARSFTESMTQGLIWLYDSEWEAYICCIRLQMAPLHIIVLHHACVEYHLNTLSNNVFCKPQTRRVTEYCLQTKVTYFFHDSFQFTDCTYFYTDSLTVRNPGTVR